MPEHKLHAYSTYRRYFHSNGVSSFPSTCTPKASLLIRVGDAEEEVGQEFDIGLLFYYL